MGGKSKVAAVRVELTTKKINRDVGMFLRFKTNEINPLTTPQSGSRFTNKGGER